MKKIIIMAFIMITIISSIMPCFAYEFNQVNLYKKGDCGQLLKYMGNPLTISYVVYKNGNKEYPAYCLYSNLAGAESGSYSVETTEKLGDDLTWRVIKNGYPYKTPSELGVANEYEAFAATKQAVYWAWEERPEAYYSAVDSDAGRRTYSAFKKIINAAKSSSETEPTNIILNVLPVTNSWEVDEIENDRVSKVYKVNSSINQGTFSVNFDGQLPSGTEITDMSNNSKNVFALNEQFKITMPIQNMNEGNSFTIIANANLKTYPVLYGRTYDPSKQDYAITGLVYEEQSSVYADSYQKNNTKIIINKLEHETQTPMQNVEFQLQDAEHNILINSTKTDGEGKIVYDNLIPGKYYIKELKTLEGYVPYTELIEVEIALFEEAKINVFNSKYKTQEVVNNSQEINVVANSSNILVESNNSDVQIIDDTQNRIDNTNIDNQAKSVTKLNTANNIKSTNVLDNELKNTINNKVDNKNIINNEINNRVENKNLLKNEIDNDISNNIDNSMVIRNDITNRTQNRVLPRTGF